MQTLGNVQAQKCKGHTVCDNNLCSAQVILQLSMQSICLPSCLSSVLHAGLCKHSAGWHLQQSRDTVCLQGQATVPAAQSQVIYSSVPVWSALLAFVFMPEETMGLTGYFGGAVIVVAGVLAIRHPSRPS